jgi:hypothetical protein
MAGAVIEVQVKVPPVSPPVPALILLLLVFIVVHVIAPHVSPPIPALILLLLVFITLHINNPHVIDPVPVSVNIVITCGDIPAVDRCTCDSPAIKCV